MSVFGTFQLENLEQLVVDGCPQTKTEARAWEREQISPTVGQRGNEEMSETISVILLNTYKSENKDFEY